MKMMNQPITRTSIFSTIHKAAKKLDENCRPVDREKKKKVQHIGSRVCAQEKAKQHTDDAVHFLNSGQGVTVIEYSGKCDTCQA